MPLESKNTHRNRRNRVHKSTKLIVLILVVVPWILVAIPGDHPNNGYSHNNYGEPNFIHGWPAIHYYGFKTDPTKNASMLQGLNAETIAFFKAEASKLPEAPKDVFNWGCSFKSYNDITDAEQSFWTDPTRWPTELLDDGTPIKLHGKVIWVGVAINIAVLLAICTAVGWFCERKIRRRGSLLKFTMTELLLMVLVLGCGFAWVNRVKDTSNEMKCLSELVYTKNAKEIRIVRTNFQRMLPTVVARLFDFRIQLPFRTTNFMYGLDSARLSMDGDFQLPPYPAERQKHISNWEGMNGKVSLVVSDGKGPREFLRSIEPGTFDTIYFDKSNNTTDNLDFLKPHASHTQLHLFRLVSADDEIDLSDLREFGPVKKCVVTIEFTLTHDEEQPKHWQNKYLKHLTEIPSISELIIENLNEGGANFLLAHPVHKKRISFSHRNSNDSFTTLDEKIWKQLVAAGFTNQSLSAASTNK